MSCDGEKCEVKILAKRKEEEPWISPVPVLPSNNFFFSFFFSSPSLLWSALAQTGWQPGSLALGDDWHNWRRARPSSNDSARCNLLRSPRTFFPSPERSHLFRIWYIWCPYSVRRGLAACLFGSYSTSPRRPPRGFQFQLPTTS